MSTKLHWYDLQWWQGVKNRISTFTTWRRLSCIASRQLEPVFWQQMQRMISTTSWTCPSCSLSALLLILNMALFQTSTSVWGTTGVAQEMLGASTLPAASAASVMRDSLAMAMSAGVGQHSFSCFFQDVLFSVCSLYTWLPQVGCFVEGKPAVPELLYPAHWVG